MKKNLKQRRENGLFAFGIDLSTVLKSLQKEKITIVDIKESWENLCEERFLNTLKPFSLRSGNLELKALFGAVALEAMASSETIKERINSFFGKEIVKNIKITQ